MHATYYTRYVLYIMLSNVCTMNVIYDACYKILDYFRSKELTLKGCMDRLELAAISKTLEYCLIE